VYWFYFLKIIPLKYLLQVFLLICIPTLLKGQVSSGSTGLLNIPSAEMQTDGTFLFGTNYLSEEFTPEKFSYNTGNYFLNVTFLPFLEVTYRCTLFKTIETGKYTQQDRTFTVRMRLLKERKYLPSLVLGGNDLYSEESDGRDQYLGSLYAVATKNIETRFFSLGLSFGRGFKAYNGGQMDGFFGGISISPNRIKELSFMAEYDSKKVNVGASVLLFKHLYLHSFLYDCKYPVGGLAYKIYLKH